MIAACRRLKESGYTIALDDFGMNDPREALSDDADIIKVDLRETSATDAAAMVKRYGPWRCRMLAEKVETREEFMAAMKAGFLYFQGYFFRRPEVLTAHEIPANRLNYLRMLTAVSPSWMYARSRTSKGRSVVVPAPVALFELGRIRIRQRNSLGPACIGVWENAKSVVGSGWVATLGAGQGKTADLVLSAMVRARFCELVSPKIPYGESELFLMGDAFDDGRHSRDSHVPGA